MNSRPPWSLCYESVPPPHASGDSRPTPDGRRILSAITPQL